MAQNRNGETEGKVGKKEEREEETSVQMEESTVRERETKSSKCESCVSKGLYDSVSIFLCLVCEIYVCAGCMDEHRSHGGMEMIDKNLLWRKKKPGIFGKLKKRVTKAFGLTPESERKKERDESERKEEREESERKKEREESERKKERMLGNFVDQLFSESETERKKELKKKSCASVCDIVNVEHELDRKDCEITGLCGLENRRWVVCDCWNYCIKIFKLGSHVIQRYIRFVGARPWDVTEIDFKQNSAEPSLVSGSSSGISGTDRADPDKPCFIAVTLPWKHQIMFIDVSKKPALLHKVLYTEERCWSIEFYEDKIFTVCSEGRLFDCLWSVYVKSTDGDTLHMFDTGIYGYPVPYLAVVSGRVYLTDWDNNKVQCRNVEGQVITDITIEGLWPVGISVDPDNNVYVCAWRNNTVYKLDADLTRYNSVLDRTTGYVERPDALCYYRDKLFISHLGQPSLGNVVTVVRLS